MTVRSNILNGETRCAYINDTLLRYIVVVYLGAKCLDRIDRDFPDLVDYDGTNIRAITSKLRNHYRSHYRETALQLLERQAEVEREIRVFDRDTLISLAG